MYVYGERRSETYNLLHSKFIWLPLAISCIIRNLVVSSSDVGRASALVGVGTTGACTGPVVTGTGAIGLNAVFTWAIVKLFTCSISFIMQKPPPIFFVMTNERWNDRSNGSDRDVDAVCFSRNIPVTVNKMIFSWNFLKSHILEWHLQATVTQVSKIIIINYRE